MNTIEIQLDGPLRSLTGHSRIAIDHREGDSVMTAMTRLADGPGRPVKERLLRPDGRPSIGLLIFLNDKPVSAETADQVSMNAGDRLLLCPPISGG